MLLPAGESILSMLRRALAALKLGLRTKVRVALLSPELRSSEPKLAGLAAKTAHFCSKKGTSWPFLM